jgi:hypothetical protein
MFSIQPNTKFLAPNAAAQYTLPPTEHHLLLETYMQNVAPLVTVLHRSTVREAFMRTTGLPQPLHAYDYLTVLCVYYAALTSMDSLDCILLTGLNRDILLKEYGSIIQENLSQPDLLSTHELLPLQLFVLFLIYYRGNNESRYVWTMLAVVLRLAKGMGLHRDGSHFRLTPFGCDMRRRTWWHICFIDFRAAEDQGTEPEVTSGLYDTKFPLNIDDKDIMTSSKSPPREHDGFTDMTFCLLRCEAVLAAQRISATLLSRTPSKSIEEKVKMVEELVDTLEKHYISACNPSVPIQWVCMTVSRMIMAKFWLRVYRFAGNSRAETLSQNTTDQVFRSSIEVLRFSRLIETHPGTVKWSWMLRVCTGWQAMAFVLSEMRANGQVSEADWETTSSTYKG